MIDVIQDNLIGRQQMAEELGKSFPEVVFELYFKDHHYFNILTSKEREHIKIFWLIKVYVLFKNCCSFNMEFERSKSAILSECLYRSPGFYVAILLPR